MRPLVSNRLRGMLFNQTVRLQPYHDLYVWIYVFGLPVPIYSHTQVLHGRRTVRDRESLG